MKLKCATLQGGCK